MKKTTVYAYIKATLFIFCLIMLVLVSHSTTMYGDDITYGTYFLGGFGEFLRLTKEHYMLTNGRALVHAVLECVLAFKDRLYFLVLPVLLISAFGMFYKAFLKDYKKTSRTAFFILCFSGVMSLSAFVLREGLLWMAGAINYIFPLILSYAVYYIVKKTDKDGKCRWYYYLAAFFSGATTEQGGAMSLAFVILYVVFYALKNKKRSNIRVYILAATVFLGYLSIFLSPATLSRFFNEAVESKKSKAVRLTELFEMCFSKKGAAWLFVITEFSLLFEIAKKHKRIASFGVILTICGAALLKPSYTVGGCVLFAVIFITVVFMFFSGTSSEIASAVMAAGAAFVMLVFSTSCGYRNLVPTYFTLIAVTAAILVKNMPKKNRAAETIVCVFAFAAATVVFMPTLSGYMHNRKIIDENYKNITNGVWEYNTDIKYPYNYVQFFEMSCYEKDFRKLYNIPENVRIKLYGEKFEPFDYKGEYCGTKYENDGKRYYPMREVLSAAGWNFSYDAGKIITEKNGKVIDYRNVEGIFEYDGKQLDASASVAKEPAYAAYFLEHIYFEENIFKEV